MDVNATLAKLREIIKFADMAPVMNDPVAAAAILATAAGEFEEQFKALDEWLSKGGFLPTDWVAPRIERALEG